jgi:hypothetical protein
MRVFMRFWGIFDGGIVLGGIKSCWYLRHMFELDIEDILRVSLLRER